MKNRYYFILACVGIAITSARAENFNNVSTGGNIVTTGWGTYVYAAHGSVQAANFMATSGYIYAGSYISAANYVSSNTYMQAPQGLFTNILRVGGGTATGSRASALGYTAKATSFSSVAIGQYNETTASDGSTATAGSWVDKDPLFEVGNGTGTVGDPNQYRNAFTIYKDGTVTMSKSQGDILMGQFGN